MGQATEHMQKECSVTTQQDTRSQCSVCGKHVPEGGRAFIAGQPSTGKVETWAHTCDGKCTELVRHMLKYAGSLPAEEMDGLHPSEMVRAALKIYAVFR